MKTPSYQEILDNMIARLPSHFTTAPGSTLRGILEALAFSQYEMYLHFDQILNPPVTQEESEKLSKSLLVITPPISQPYIKCDITAMKDEDDFKIELDLPEKNNISRFEEIQKELSELGSYDMLSIDGQTLHDKLNTELRELQNICHWHTFETIKLAFHVKKICMKCGFEDKDYNHFLG